MNKEKLKAWAIKLLQFVVNPRFLLCVGIAWIITNGWSYIMMALGTYFQIEWMMLVAGGYLTFLWLPISPEKVATFAIAIALLRWWFPQDKKTLAVLQNLYRKAKGAIKKRKAHGDMKPSEAEKEEGDNT